MVSQLVPPTAAESGTSSMVAAAWPENFETEDGEDAREGATSYCGGWLQTSAPILQTSSLQPEGPREHSTSVDGPSLPRPLKLGPPLSGAQHFLLSEGSGSNASSAASQALTETSPFDLEGHHQPPPEEKSHAPAVKDAAEAMGVDLR